MNNNSSNFAVPDYTLSHAHGTVMVLAWMVFASTGILFARYGRLLRIGKRRQLLSQAIWFQAHRLALCLASIATLLGFFLILAQAGGTWVDAATDGQRLFAHSVFGGIIVCSAMLQVWMALFRCHSGTRYRFIFNWTHRVTGLLAFTLSIPTLFLITYVLPFHHDGLVSIMSIWTAWVVIVVVAFEFLEYRSRVASRISAATNKVNTDGIEHQLHPSNSPPNVEAVRDENLENERVNKMKLILLGIHVIFAIALAISFIVLIWKQS